MPKETLLPQASELRKRAKAARERMVELFRTRKDLEMVKPYLSVGLARLDQKRDVALMLSKYSKKRGIRTVETIADLLYIGNDHLEVLQWMTFPVAFQDGHSKRSHDCYLLALCNLEWHPAEKKWIESK